MMISKRPISDWHIRCSKNGVPQIDYGVIEYFKARKYDACLFLNDETQSYRFAIENIKSMMSNQSVYVYLHETNIFPSRKISAVESFFKSEFFTEIEIKDNIIIEFSDNDYRLMMLLYWMILIGARIYCIDDAGTIVYISQHGEVFSNKNFKELSILTFNLNDYSFDNDWLHNEEDVYILHQHKILNRNLISIFEDRCDQQYQRISSSLYFPFLIQKTITSFEYPTLFIHNSDEMKGCDIFFSGWLSNIIASFSGYHKLMMNLDSCSSKLILLASLLVPNGVPCVIFDAYQNKRIVFNGRSFPQSEPIVFVNEKLRNWLVKEQLIANEW